MKRENLVRENRTERRTAERRMSERRADSHRRSNAKRNVRKNNNRANLVLAAGFVAAAVVVAGLCIGMFSKKSDKAATNYMAVNTSENATSATATQSATQAVTVSSDAKTAAVDKTAATQNTTAKTTAATQSTTAKTTAAVTTVKPVALDSAKVEKIVATAKAMVGKKYVSGAADPKVGFDSSGLVQYAYAQAGISVTRSSASLYAECNKVAKEDAQVGDLVFFSDTTDGSNAITNVGIYIGDNKMVSCSPEEVKVQDLTKAYYTEHLVAYGSIPALAK